MFVTLGDLISEMELTVTETGAGSSATLGEALQLQGSSDIEVLIRVRDPAGPNQHGDRPEVSRIDLILGEVTGPVANRDQDTNSTTRVPRRFTAADWIREGEYLTMRTKLPDVHHSSYIRVRGTSGQELEPQVDPAGEDPWSDLWFYSNPIFLEVR